ncbi:MAG: hypothetical protein OXG35_14960 [Acidobacteria bacterium]|nr:hypothetical protein [Acidobacteriota bacterium]
MRTILTAAVLLLAPAALAAQTLAESRRHMSMYRTWTIDSVLVALASDTETREAAKAATAILRGSGGRQWKQVEGIGSPLSQAERDAFGERLVAIAIAHPESDVADEIVMTMMHINDFDAVLRMYEAGAGNLGLYYLFRIDPRRGIEVGMEKLRANRWRVRTDLAEARARLGDAFRPKVPGFFEMCDFIGDLAPPFGTLAVVNGQPVFTFHEGVDLSPMSDGRQPTKEEYDALDDATNELYEAGVIDSPCPHPGYPPGASFYTKHDPPTRPRGR